MSRPSEPGRVVVVGSLNCDLVTRAPRRPARGETLTGSGFETFVGGKGANQAIAAARAGASVSMVGRVGDDPFASVIEGKLAEAGVDARFVVRDRGSRTGVADILVEDSGDNSIVVVPLANGRLCAADVEAAGALFEGARVVLLQLEVPLEAVAAAARAAKAAGATVILNPAPAAPLPAGLLADVDWLTPNETELALLAPGEPDAAVRALLARGPSHVVVTLGDQGARWSGDPAPIPAFRVPVVDTTAAGDAFCGALAAALARGAAPREALRFASAAGALACTKLGAEPSLPHRADVEALAG